jgi:hypothetical protein
MSNNKQTMKLYTEEQMHTVMLLALGKYQIHSNRKVLKENQDLIYSINPIELPSDEEIENGYEPKTMYDLGYLDGAKWMRDKIQGGNK